MDREQTGKLIADRRKELGLTQKELAQRLHVTDRAVSKWERGIGFPDVSLLLPLAEALMLPVLDLLRGEQNSDAELMDSNAAVREALSRVQQESKKQRPSRKVILQAVSCLLLFWVMLSCFGMIFIPVDRTQTAVVYQDGIPQEYTLVRWKGRLLYRLPFQLEFQGQLQTSLVQTSLSPERNMKIYLPLALDHTTSVYRKIWHGNIRSEDGPFLENDFYLDWWGKEFAFCLSDGSVVATSKEALSAFPVK